MAVRDTIVAESVQYVPIPVTFDGDGPTDLALLPVECAVLPDGARPSEADWRAGLWLDANVAGILVGPGSAVGSLPLGQDVRGWARISTGAAERPVVYTSNTLRVV